MPASLSALFTADEEARRQALQNYFIAGTAPEKLFDDLASLTARLFGAPVGLVSLVTADRVWFKAEAGLPGASSVPREDSLCSVVVLKGSSVVFENLEKAPCSLVNPDVAQTLELRFYAGAPLTDPDGRTMGALCVMDRTPRTFNPDEEALLKRLAAVVMRTIELRLASLRDPSPNNLPLNLAFNTLQYAIERISEQLQRHAATSEQALAAERTTSYRVVSEVIDYVEKFVGGTLALLAEQRTNASKP